MFLIIAQLFSLTGTCMDPEIFMFLLFQNFPLPPRKSYTLFILMLLSVPSFCWLILSQVSFIIRCLKMLHKLEMGFNFQLCKDTCQTFSGHCHGTKANVGIGRMNFDIVYVLSCSGNMEHGLQEIRP